MIVEGGGWHKFIYSCSAHAQLISFGIDCLYSLWARTYEYEPPPQLSISNRMWHFLVTLVMHFTRRIWFSKISTDFRNASYYKCPSFRIIGMYSIASFSIILYLVPVPDCFANFRNPDYRASPPPLCISFFVVKMDVISRPLHIFPVLVFKNSILSKAIGKYACHKEKTVIKGWSKWPRQPTKRPWGCAMFHILVR